MLVKVAKVVPPSLIKTSPPPASRITSRLLSRVISPVELRVKVVVGVIVSAPSVVISSPFTARSPAIVKLPELSIVLLVEKKLTEPAGFRVRFEPSVVSSDRLVASEVRVK